MKHILLLIPVGELEKSLIHAPFFVSEIITDREKSLKPPFSFSLAVPI